MTNDNMAGAEKGQGEPWPRRWRSVARRGVSNTPDLAHQAQVDKTARLKIAKLASDAAARALDHSPKA